MFTKKNIEKKYKQLSGIKKQFRFQKQYFDPQNVINIFFQFFFVEKFLAMTLLNTHTWLCSREIGVHNFSENTWWDCSSFFFTGCVDIWIFYLMTEGKQEDKKHWFFRTGNCTPVWRKDGIKAIWNIIGIASFSNSFQPKKALIKFTDKCQ